MRPRKVPTSNACYVLPGGNEDNDLWAEKNVHDFTITSVWELTDEERKKIAEGGTIELIIWAAGHPPVALEVGPSIEERKNGA